MATRAAIAEHKRRPSLIGEYSDMVREEIVIGHGPREDHKEQVFLITEPLEVRS